MPSSQILLVTGILLSAVPLSAFEPVPLSDAPVLRADGVHDEVIEAKRIAGPLSIQLRHCTGVTIRYCDLSAISLTNCQKITIENCYLHDSTRNGVEAVNCSGILVQGCRMENVSSGMYAQDCQQVRFIGNFVRNVNGPFPRGQMAQFNEITGSGNEISHNYGVNEHGHSHPEDMINLFRSEGTADTPILVEDNYLTGDPAQGSEGKSQSGSGIMLGDNGGAYQTCRHNVIIAAGQAGIGVAGGKAMVVEDNLIAGQKSDIANVGLYVWNQSDRPGGAVTVRRNRVHWFNHEGTPNPYWNGGGFTEVTEAENRFGDATVLSEVPKPPSVAPMPPRPAVSADGVVRLPWVP